MALKIIRGKQASPVGIVLYGLEGIGKTTLASQFPNPVVLDTEDGTRQLDVARVSCPDWVTLEGAMHELVRDSQGFKSVVIDSADWAERHVIEAIKSKANKRSIEDFGFGKGYVMVAEQITRLLSLADQLMDRGLHVVFVAHSEVKRVSPPDELDGYDRWQLKLTKQSGPLFREWADALLFCNWKVAMVEGSDGRTKARGGKERVLHTQHTAAFDAKNRYGLDAELPMAITSLSHLWESGPKPAKQPTLRERIADAETVEALGEIGDLVDDMESRGKLTADQVATLRGLVDERHRVLEPAAFAEAADA
jgi:hypothetical protein